MPPRPKTWNDATPSSFLQNTLEDMKCPSKPKEGFGDHILGEVNSHYESSVIRESRLGWCERFAHMLEAGCRQCVKRYVCVVIE